VLLGQRWNQGFLTFDWLGALSPGANQRHNSSDFPTAVCFGPSSQLNVTHKSEGDVSFMDRDTKFLEMKTPAAWHKSKGKRTHKRSSMNSNEGFLEIKTPRIIK